MNYRAIYYSIIDKYKNQPGVTEKHHILPRSMGGSNDPENLVEVSPRVHYILHLLLYRFTEGDDKRKMYFAVWNMSHQGKAKTGAMYQFLREACKEKHLLMVNRIPWNKGKKGYKINQRPQKGIPKVTSYKPIEFEDVVYQSIKEAVEKSGRSYYIVTKRGTRIHT